MTVEPTLDVGDDMHLLGFPPGTVSGAPKVRAMEIIDELEKEKRGTLRRLGVGYFSATGEMDTCIVLRTALLKGRHVRPGRRRHRCGFRSRLRAAGMRQQSQGTLFAPPRRRSGSRARARVGS